MAIVTAFDIAKQHYEAEIEQLTRDLEAARAERDELKYRVEELHPALEAELRRVKKENEEFFTALDNRAHDLAELKAENDRLTSEDESLTQQLVNVLRHLAEAKQQIESLGLVVNKARQYHKELAEAKAQRDKFFDQLSLILNSDSQAVDWEASLETNETPPRPVRVTGKSKGAIDYVVVEIYGEDTSTGSQFDNPNGEYSASKQGGFIRGRLAVRNKFGLAELRRENEQLTEALGHATGIAGFSPLNCSECANIEALAAKARCWRILGANAGCHRDS